MPHYHFLSIALIVDLFKRFSQFIVLTVTHIPMRSAESIHISYNQLKLPISSALSVI